MNEIAPGIWHWTAPHPAIRIRVSSYYLIAERVLIDPIAPEDGLDWFDEHGAPTDVLLTNRHHYRSSAQFVERFGVDAMKFVNSPLGRQLHLRGINARVVRAGAVRVGDIARKRV